VGGRGARSKRPLTLFLTTSRKQNRRTRLCPPLRPIHPQCCPEHGEPQIASERCWAWVWTYVQPPVFGTPCPRPRPTRILRTRVNTESWVQEDPDYAVERFPKEWCSTTAWDPALAFVTCPTRRITPAPAVGTTRSRNRLQAPLPSAWTAAGRTTLCRLLTLTTVAALTENHSMGRGRHIGCGVLPMDFTQLPDRLLLPTSASPCNTYLLVKP